MVSVKAARRSKHVVCVPDRTQADTRIRALHEQLERMRKDGAVT